MLGHKSNVSLVRYMVLVVLFLLSAGLVGAQTPATTPEKLNAGTPKLVPGESPAVTDISTVAGVTSETVATKPVADPVRAEISLMNAKADGAPKVDPGVATPPAPAPPAQCKRMIKADVVAIAQPIMLNRLGTAIPGGMIFALRRDTVGGLGKQLRADKRPRPIVLRANVGDCLTIKFENAIPAANFVSPAPPATATSTT